MYHLTGEVHNERERKYTGTPRRFVEQMEALARVGMCAVGDDGFVAWIEGRSGLEQGSFLWTFGDGFLGVRDHAAAELRELDWPATVFLITDLLGGTDRRLAARRMSYQADGKVAHIDFNGRTAI